MKCSEYTIDDTSYSKPYSIFNIKKLKIYGNYIFEKNEIIRIVKNAVTKFINTNKDVDYLIVYYYPSYKDMNNAI